MATTGERAALRISLLDRGFDRVATSRDIGDGAYIEIFTKGQNKVTIEWGPKTEIKEFGR